ncbi:TetR/AcrR family transcriptional regulator [Gordonia hydrophobica]|uniref:TetR/AcrR family transcriptional regulator n=1 Tax=Gordonia hydrophobica TaxID=40516 RepID=A0ABZ2TVM5_9ACTN|nr:TetR/AcrR family transcriptional regulator [Gordonia hydrophobica]MBM7366065.1 AcrR family transcriptional regulator [Gordonia hydrophobica]
MAKKSVPSEHARRRFLDAGLTVLGEGGHAGLKLAQVCRAAGATTGSFYHAFGNWADFKTALIAYWRHEQSRRLIDAALAVADPRERVAVLTDIGLTLDRASESAIRVWATHDDEVRRHLQEVDRERAQVIAATTAEVIADEDEADAFAQVAMYLMIGYQMSTAPSLPALRAGFRALLEHTMGADAPPVPDA